MIRLTPKSWRRSGGKRRTSLTSARKDTHVTQEQAPQGIGIDAQMPNSMPRGEDDATTRAGSPEFHDRPGSGKHTANRRFIF